MKLPQVHLFKEVVPYKVDSNVVMVKIQEVREDFLIP